MCTDELVEKPGIDRELLLRFFLFFSRFEYALKRGGYANSRNDKVEPNWDRFASDYEDAFQEQGRPSVEEATDHLLDNAPDVQTLEDDGSLGWREIRYGSDKRLGKALHCIRTVRNNLFHGGKFPQGPVTDPSRDEELLRRSVTVLQAVLDLAPKVKAPFEASFSPSAALAEVEA